LRRTLSAAVTATAALTLAGCQSTATTVNTTPAGTSAAPAAHASVKGAPATSAAPKKAGVGSAIDLRDKLSGDALQVTLVKIVDPAKSTNQFLTPDAGTRYVAVQFRIVNKGKTVYSDDPQLEAKAKDALGESFDPELAAITSAGVALDPGLKLAPGDTALGFLVFQVPTGKKITQVQYSASLFGGTVAQWTIG
jgi:hypothetical protein